MLSFAKFFFLYFFVCWLVFVYLYQFFSNDLTPDLSSKKYKSIVNLDLKLDLDRLCSNRKHLLSLHYNFPRHSSGRGILFGHFRLRKMLLGRVKWESGYGISYDVDLTQK